MANITNVRTDLQFSKGQRVFLITFNGNKLMAMNSIRSQYGVKSFSILNEYMVKGFLPEGYHTVN